MSWLRVSVCFGLAWFSVVCETELAQAVFICTSAIIIFLPEMKVSIINNSTVTMKEKEPT